MRNPETGLGWIFFAGMFTFFIGLMTLDNVGNAVRRLRDLGYTVRRYKIEDTLLDSRHDGDIFANT